MAVVHAARTRAAARFAQQHAQPQVGQVRSPRPLHHVEGGGVGGKQGGNACHGQPQQHLVTQNHPAGCRKPSFDAALARGSDQGKVARAGDGQDDDEGDDKGAVVGNTEHGETPVSVQMRGRTTDYLPLRPTFQLSINTAITRRIVTSRPERLGSNALVLYDSDAISTMADDSFKGLSMKKLLKATVAVAVVSGVALLSGCTGQVYNQQKNCSYDYLFHPSVSISKVIGGCGPIDKLPQQQ
ncbi:hypothetical protein D3C81_1305910 [compost metagenome]